MRILFSILILTLLCPAQTWASGLELLKPRTTAVEATMVQTGASIQLSQFSVTRSNGRTDWFVTVANTSNKNLPRNTIAVRGTQYDHKGTASSAGDQFTLTQDLRPGKSLNLQRQFSQTPGIARISIEVIDTRNNAVLGSGTFSASTANPGNIASPAGTGAAATTENAMGNSVGANAQKEVLEGPNLIVTIAETVVEKKYRKLKLTVTNQGTTSVNLNRYKIELQGHQMFRPAQSKDIKFTQTVQPGAQVSQTIDEFEHSNCSNFTHYTVTARDNGSPMIFNGQLDLSPPQIAIRFIGMTVKYSDNARGFEQNIGDEFSITVDVTNNSDRWLINPSAMGTMAVDGGKHPYPFDMPVQLALAPGQKQRVKILFPIDQMSAFTTLYSNDFELWRIKPTWARATLYFGSSLYCGVQTMDGNVIHAEWKK